MRSPRTQLLSVQRLSAVVALSLLGTLAATNPGAAAAPASSAAQSYIVEFRPGEDPAAAAATTGGEVKRTFKKALNGAVVSLTPQEAEALKRDPRVKRIELDGEVRAADIQLSPPWGLDRSDQRTRALDASFTYPTTGGSGVTAYVVDTGITASHVDFAGRIDPGFTAITDGLGTSDCNGHGTHVSATLAGSTYGVAKRARITPVRVLDCTSTGAWSGVIAGLDWIVANHPAGAPAVANMSLSGGAIATVDTAVRNVIADGVTVVVAAGNNGLDACGYSPARVADAITVAATNNLDTRPTWSNYGSCVDLFAPGDSITSAWHTSSTAANSISGTSMAAPHVAGAVALQLGANAALTPAAMTTAILGNATLGCLAGPGAGSPNRLLYIGSAPQPTSCTSTSGTAPSAPTEVTASAGRKSATVSWTKGSDGGLALTSQQVNVYRSGALARSVVVSATATSVSITSLAAGSSYTFRVSATNAAGTSPLSASSNTVVPLK